MERVGSASDRRRRDGVSDNEVDTITNSSKPGYSGSGLTFVVSRSGDRVEIQRFSQ
jgi:hypothetical protein